MSTYEEKYLGIIKEIILANIDKEKYNVFLFGSRARIDNDDRADVDIGILGTQPLGNSYNKIMDEIEESIVPYKIEIIDFNNVREEFKKEALKNIVIWNKAQNLKII